MNFAHSILFSLAVFAAFTPSVVAQKATGPASNRGTDPVAVAMRKELADPYHKARSQPWGSMGALTLDCSVDGNAPPIRASVDARVPSGAWVQFNYRRHSVDGGWAGQREVLECGALSVDQGVRCVNKTSGEVQTTVRMFDEKSNEMSTGGKPQPFLTVQAGIYKSYDEKEVRSEYKGCRTDRLPTIDTASRRQSPDVSSQTGSTSNSQPSVASAARTEQRVSQVPTSPARSQTISGSEQAGAGARGTLQGAPTGKVFSAGNGCKISIDNIRSGLGAPAGMIESSVQAGRIKDASFQWSGGCANGYGTGSGELIYMANYCGNCEDWRKTRLVGTMTRGEFVGSVQMFVGPNMNWDAPVSMHQGNFDVPGNSSGSQSEIAKMNDNNLPKVERKGKLEDYPFPDANSCLRVKRKVAGNMCGRPDGGTVEIVNICGTPVNIHLCLLKKNGKWDCGSNSTAMGDSGVANSVCDADGRYAYAGCFVEVNKGKRYKSGLCGGDPNDGNSSLLHPRDWVR